MINYISVQDEHIHEIEIKKSRFIAHMIPVKNETDINQCLTSIQKNHYKANHHCFAYILEKDASIQRMGDDGEPSGTAGIPILEVLKQKQLTYILAVVVRYFGGIKLGAGGLIRAYSQAVSECCQKAKFIKNIDQVLVRVELDYPQLDRFNYEISLMTPPPTQLDIIYTDKIQLQLAMNEELYPIFYQNFINHFNGQIIIEKTGQQTINVPTNAAELP